MPDTPEDPVLNWSHIENRETVLALCSAAYGFMLSRAPKWEALMTWLLGGVAATAGLLVANVDKVGSALGQGGVRWCLFLMTASLIFGVLGRSVAAFYALEGEGPGSLRKKLAELYQLHDAERRKIEEAALASGRPLPPDIVPAELISEFVRPFPRMLRPAVRRSLNKLVASKERQGDYMVSIRGLAWMIALGSLQVVAALAALIVVAATVSPTS